MFEYNHFIRIYKDIFNENVEEKDRIYCAVVFHEILNRVMGNTILDIGSIFDG